MSINTAFDVVIQGGNENTRNVAAIVIERAFGKEGFVNVETHVQRERNERPTLLDIMREEGPHLFEKHAVVQELTTLPVVSGSYRRVRDDEGNLDDEFEIPLEDQEDVFE